MSSAAAPSTDPDTAETPLESSVAAPRMDLDTAETPLEAEEDDWLAAAMLRCSVQRERVKHSFVHVRLAADWLSHPWHLDLDINDFLQISVNRGNWHGTADYYNDVDGRGCWKLTFHHSANTSLMKTTVYKQIQSTCTYLSIESKTSNQWNCMLISKDA